MFSCTILKVREIKGSNYSVYAEDETGNRMIFTFDHRLGIIPLEGDTVECTRREGKVIPLVLNGRKLPL